MTDVVPSAAPLAQFDREGLELAGRAGSQVRGAAGHDG